MKRPLFLNPGKFATIIIIAMMTSLCASAQDHPAYMQALSNLRAARWLIDHRPGNWQQTNDEIFAVRSIDDAINEIQRSNVDDHRNIMDHPAVQEIPDRGGRLQKAIEMLRETRNDINQRENDAFSPGLKVHALHHVDEAINACNTAIAQGTQGVHPAYLQALADLRVARWMFTNRPANWQQTVDEIHAVQAIEAAISEIQKAAIDDGKNINDHTPVQEIPDRAGRITKAIDMLNATRNDVNQREDDGFAQGLKGRALQDIDQAIRDARMALSAPTLGAHPAYMQALSDMRVARYLIDHRPGGWQQSPLEANAVREIDGAMNEIKKAAIDDGKNVNDHAPVDEIQDRGGRMHRAMDMLRNTRRDVAQREDDGYAQGLKARALKHIDAALNFCQQAINNY